MSSRRRSRRRRQNFNILEYKNHILGGIGIFAAVAIIAGVLCSRVIEDNKLACSLTDGNEYQANLFGCIAEEKYSYDNIIIVAGNTSNTAKPELTKLARRYITNSLLKNPSTEIKAYSAATGANRIRFKFDKDGKSFAEAYEKTIRDKEKMQLIRDYADAIEVKLQTAPATDGVDYLEAIEKSASHSDEDGKNLIIVIGSGLSDSGKLDFANEKILTRKCKDDKYCTAEELAVEFSKRDNKENLIGHDLIWSGLGNDIQPQQPLNADLIDKLTNLYETILSNKGAEVLELADELSSDESVKTDKTVEPTVPVMNDGWWAEKRIFGENSALAFQPQGGRFIDEAKAREVIQTLADATKSGQKFRVTAYVALARCSDQRKIQYAEARAQRIVDMVGELGGKPENIEAIASREGAVDECPGGVINSELQKQNRSVHIEPINEGNYER